MKNDLELRMYGLVPYNISPIQQAIQFGHAVVEYSINNLTVREEIAKYQDWAKNWKTFIILNGGTSNNINTLNHMGQPDTFKYSDQERVGTMEHNLFQLKEAEINCATFYEPDLNNMLSAIVFIVDERVFNKEDYPDFIDWSINEYGNADFSTRYEERYSRWLDLIGGKQNEFLRTFLSQFKLA